jgi:hypothetical protein
MKQRFRTVVLALAALAATLVPTMGRTSVVPAIHAATPVGWEFKGFSMAPYWHDALYGSGPALE